jgi:hypothetical protein
LQVKAMQIEYQWWWAILISLIALGVIVTKVLKPPTPVFDFNNGTTQGWTFDGVYDDAGKHYNGGFFPPNYLGNFQGTQLVFAPNQLGLYLIQLGFPKTSKYWRVDLVSPNLGPAWYGLKGIKASIRDQIGMVDAVLEVKPFVRYGVSGTEMETPAQGAFNPTLPHDKWTVVSENMSLPAGATLLNIVLRIRGRWATPGSPVLPLYEGQVYVDDVTKIL